MCQNISQLGQALWQTMLWELTAVPRPLILTHSSSPSVPQSLGASAPVPEIHPLHHSEKLAYQVHVCSPY